MPHLHSFSAANFRVFAAEQSFNFKPITILTGTNSAGKSSLIRALMLLRNSIKRHPELGVLTFGDTSALGDFSSVLNDEHSERDRVMYFTFPFHLDYLEGDYQLELAYEQEPTGLQRDGKLVCFHIFRQKEQQQETLVHVSFRPFDVEEASTKFKDEWHSLEDEERKRMSSSYVHCIKLNLQLVKDQLSKDLERIETEQGIRHANELVGQEDAGSFTLFASSADLYDEIMPSFRYPFYDNSSLRKLNLQELSKNKLSEAELGLSEGLIFQYYPKGPGIKYGPFTANSLNRLHSLDEATLSQIKQAEHEMLVTVLQGTSLIVPKHRIPDTSVWMFRDGSEHGLEGTIMSAIFEKLRAELGREEKDLSGHLSKDLTYYGNWLLQKYFIKNILNGFSKLEQQLSINFMGSTRGAQRRYFAQENDSHSLHELIEAFIEAEAVDVKVIQDFLEYWTQKFGLGDRISLEIGNSGLTKAIFIHRKGKKINLADLGFGVSQLLPILLNICLTAKKKADNWENGIVMFGNSVVCIEEPEANLHPALQSKFADLLIDAAHKFNIQFIVETHSEYLVRKLQYWTAMQVIGPEAVNIYYFYDPENIPPGEPQIKEITIDDNGKLSDDFGTGFFDEADRIAISIWNRTQASNN
ncbi:Protein of unknown function [Cnuella takakiae]|uniref:AAA ATPase domain-containing protein n=1 Tax=Cnuella takakiae TaxID=1302690 RepID=A0A1M4TCP6_9BACT|nr:DUF3696 domain-containing protein [Cnuella takakiae]OLY90711.1 hypothetical protein BUE76_01465 [Cnuella takakiae]SHE42246.1 Protein of unknown function [Cnuella takakiae]